MTKSKAILLSTATLAIIGLGAIGVHSTFAAEQVNGNSRWENMSQALAQHFGLNQNDVQTFMNEHHAQIMADHSKEQLTKAVEKGLLTADQAIALQAKHEEMHASFVDLKDLSAKERQNLIKEHRAEMETWAKEQGIELPVQGLGKGFGEGKKGEGKGRGGMHRMMGQNQENIVNNR